MLAALTLRQNRSDNPLLPAIREQRLQIRPHLIGNHLMPFGSRMDAIGRMQIRVSSYIPQQKGHEVEVDLLLQLSEDLTEPLGIALSQIGWSLHARQKDHDVGVALTDFIHDALQVLFRKIRIDPPQAIIATQAQNKDIDRLLQYPIDATQPACGGLSAGS